MKEFTCEYACSQGLCEDCQHIESTRRELIGRTKARLTDRGGVGKDTFNLWYSPEEATLDDFTYGKPARLLQYKPENQPYLTWKILLDETLVLDERTGTLEKEMIIKREPTQTLIVT